MIGQKTDRQTRRQRGSKQEADYVAPLVKSRKAGLTEETVS